MASASLTKKLQAARLLVYNSKDPSVAPLLATMGIHDSYINRGIKLYEDAMTLVEDQKKEYQEQNMAYDNFYTEKDGAEEKYNRTLKIVKVLCRKDPDLQNRLGFGKGKAYGIEEWIEGAVDFYNSLLNEEAFLAQLANFNVTAERLMEEKEAVSQLRHLRNQATLEKGQAQEATRLRNEKLEELEDYMTELKTMAEIALEGHGQLLEKLGIIVRS